MPTVGARRHAEKMLDWGVDAVIAQGGEGGGHTGTVPTSLLLPQVVDAVGDAHPGAGRGRLPRRPGPRRRPGLGRRRRRHGHPLPAHRRRAACPTTIKPRYLAAAVTDTVVTTALDGAPQRVIRTEMVDRLERSSLVTRLPRALRPPLRVPQGHRHAAAATWCARAWPCASNQDLTWAQLAMAANAPMLIKAALVDGDARGRRAADRPGHRRHRRAAHRGRAARPHRAPRPSADAWQRLGDGRGRDVDLTWTAERGGVPGRGPGLAEREPGRLAGRPRRRGASPRATPARASPSTSTGSARLLRRPLGGRCRGPSERRRPRRLAVGVADLRGGVLPGRRARRGSPRTASSCWPRRSSSSARPSSRTTSCPAWRRPTTCGARAGPSPNAGSDLAAHHRPGPRRVDGGWVLDGQKTWTTRGAFCTHLFGLFRTDPDSRAPPRPDATCSSRSTRRA